MASALSRAGHNVHLLTMQLTNAYNGVEPKREEIRENIAITRLDVEEFFNPNVISNSIERYAPDALVGATVYGSCTLAATNPKLPFWADQFGHFMAEAQALAHHQQNNWPLAHFWRHLEPVLHTADKISTVSRRQRYATIGELGTVGRLNAETAQYEFTAVIPCATMPVSAETKPTLRPNTVPEDAFVVFWSGSYNVWSDVDTLFDGLQVAMESNPRIHFVSTGGGISGHDIRTYAHFKERIASSPFHARFHLQGWVDTPLVASFQAEADLGVLTEHVMYEGRLGHKNRVVQWMANGLPVAYNAIGDLGEELRQHETGLVFEVNDGPGLAQQILWAADHPEDLDRLAQRAQAYAQKHHSIDATTSDLVAWANAPQKAPDAELKRAIRSPADFAPQTASAPTLVPTSGNGISPLAIAEQRADRAEQQLDDIHSSKMWHFWMASITFRQRLRSLIGRS